MIKTVGFASGIASILFVDSRRPAVTDRAFRRIQQKGGGEVLNENECCVVQNCCGTASGASAGGQPATELQIGFIQINKGRIGADRISKVGYNVFVRDLEQKSNAMGAEPSFIALEPRSAHGQRPKWLRVRPESVGRKTTHIGVLNPPQSERDPIGISVKFNPN
ncbi:MAG TPA: hypothetical protein VMC10_21160 [Stellaceae bacterium]|nr:hypothetical protein [Stellaceae bacterium]